MDADTLVHAHISHFLLKINSISTFWSPHGTSLYHTKPSFSWRGLHRIPGSPMLSTTTFPVGPLACNCTLIIDTHAKKAVIIDPGGDAPKILTMLGAHNVQVESIIHTHAHIDHVGATADICRATGATAYLHPSDLQLYRMLPQQATMLGIAEVEAVAMAPLMHQQIFSCGSHALEIIHTPGHSPGSVCIRADGIEACLTGDTLFNNGIGRYDFPGGSASELKKSIVSRLLTMHSATKIIPGHGPATTIDKERFNLLRRWG